MNVQTLTPYFRFLSVTRNDQCFDLVRPESGLNTWNIVHEKNLFSNFLHENVSNCLSIKSHFHKMKIKKF